MTGFVRRPPRPHGGRSSPDAALVARFMVHELRTPLAALAGEVELALRRDRTPEAYRDVLTRMSNGIAELTALTEDVAVLCGRNSGSDTESAISIARVIDGVDVVADLDRATLNARVLGDQALLGRALSLLVRHARLHYGRSAAIRLCDERGLESSEANMFLVLEMTGRAISRSPWDYLCAPIPADATKVDGAAYVRLLTAVQIIEDAGGTVAVTADDAGARVRIGLRRARD